MERFWVDGNGFTGTIPSDAHLAWPNLRSLDLYSNRLTGPVPAALGRFQDLIQLQLQDNLLSDGPPSLPGGQALFSLGAQPSLVQADLRMNENLTGKLGIDSPLPETRSSRGWWAGKQARDGGQPAVYISGTAIRVLVAA